MAKRNAPRRSSPPGTNASATNQDFTDADFAEMLVAAKHETQQRLKQFGVCRDLDSERRDQLIEIVVQLSAAYNLWQGHPQFEKWLRIDQRDGGGQRRKFTAKVKKALAAVDDALQYVSDLESRVPRNEFFARTLQGFAILHLQAAKKALETIPLEWRNFTTPGSGSGLENPKREARAALMAFFVETCGFTKSKASVRTARIGNALLGWSVDEYDHHESANPTRSRAVLKSIARQAKRR